MPTVLYRLLPILICYLLLLTYVPAIAQNRSYRQVNTQAVRTFTRRQFPDYTKKLDELESRIPGIAAKGDNKLVYQIPVIIHVLTTGSQQMPDARQIQAQLDTLNKYFGHYTPQTKDFPNEDVEKYAALGVDVGIQFFIPDKIGDLPGIHIVKTDHKSWELFNQIQDPKQGGLHQ